MENSKKMAKSTILVIAILLFSKLVGFGRSVLLANYFGAGFETDAMVSAQTATAQISVFISTAITSMMIPMLSKVSNEKGQKGKNKFVNNMINIGTVFSMLLVILGIVFAPVIIRVLGSGFDEQSFTLTVELTRIYMPVILFASIIGILSGYLQSEEQFGIANAAQIPLNMTYILYLIFFSSSFGIKGYAVAGIIGSIAQIMLLLPVSIKHKFKPMFILDIRDNYVRTAIRLSFPIILGTLVSNINDLVNVNMASGLDSGSLTWLDNANKLNLLILGVFVAALVSVVYPSISDAFNSKNYKAGKESMISAVRFISLIILPCTVGLFLLAQPVVEIAFMRGEFTQYSADMTAIALKAYVLGLFALSLQNILTKVFYSLHNTRAPLVMGVFTMIVNVILKLILIKPLGHVGLALAFSVAINVSVLLLFLILRLQLKQIGGTEYVKMIGKLGLASLLMGVVTYFSFFGVGSLVPTLMVGTAKKLLLLLFSVGVSAFFYGIICYRMRIPEVTMAVDFVKGKFRRK